MPRTTLLLGCCLVLASAALTWYWHPAAVPPTPTAAEPSSAASTQSASAEREARLAQRRDPNFERYKADEQRIVEDLLALQDIPDGLSRDQYLRQRLQEARERSYQ